jgi:hypothetical protein
MNHFRIEFYEGCSLTLSPMFDRREDAEQYRQSHPLAETRVITVDKKGAAETQLLAHPFVGPQSSLFT